MIIPKRNAKKIEAYAAMAFVLGSTGRENRS
jgi:hypothetical protein